MNKRNAIRTYTLAVLLILITTTPVFGKEYQSLFGFAVDIPEHWLVLSGKVLKENLDLSDFIQKRLGISDKNFLKDIESKVKSGEFEFYFNQKTSDRSFADNIVVTKYVGEIPKNNTQLRDACNFVQKQLSSWFGREINFYQCKLVDINSLKSLCIEHDGAVQGTRSIQYTIEKSSSVKIIITATCKNSVIDTIRKEFNRIVLSIRM